MHNIVESLIKKNALSTNTIVTAKYLVKGQLGCYFKTDDFKIIGIKNNQEIVVKNLIDDRTINITFQNIQYIDGMDIKRYVQVYDLNLDGSDKPLGKKRGRKAKAPLAA
jgi:hypothetical protein